MITEVIPIFESDNFTKNDKMDEAAMLIREGQLVAFPTETVYGLGADAENPEASARIYAAKGRPSDNPLIVHIAEVSDLERAAREVTPFAKALAEAFWPGPLTLVLPKGDNIPLATTGGLDTVAVRLPNNSIARALIRQSGCMIAAPSANRSGRPSPTTAAHVLEDMNGIIPMILDGGPVGIGIESTIVDCTGDAPVILRPGYITRDMVAEICGSCSFDPAITGQDPTARPKAPGMKYRHYAPKAPLTIIEGNSEKVISFINSKLENTDEPQSIGVICTEETQSAFSGGHLFVVGTRLDEATIAHNLYGALRHMDEAGVSEIYSESFDTPGLGEALMNRLLKAAGGSVIKV